MSLSLPLKRCQPKAVPADSITWPRWCRFLYFGAQNIDVGDVKGVELDGRRLRICKWADVFAFLWESEPSDRNVTWNAGFYHCHGHHINTHGGFAFFILKQEIAFPLLYNTVSSDPTVAENEVALRLITKTPRDTSQKYNQMYLRCYGNHSNTNCVWIYWIPRD